MSIATEPKNDTLSGGSRPHKPDMRVRPSRVLNLVELDPQLIIDGDMASRDGAVRPVVPAGTMREACPHCGLPLKLVLRYQHVTRSHMYCEQCTRCYDAVLANGHSALVLTGLSID